MDSLDSLIAAPARRARAACLLLPLAASAFGSSAHAQSAVRGKMLYGPPVPSNWPITCGSSGCHDGFPATRKAGIDKGANAPNVILNAISANKGAMGILQGYVTATDAADIAAYIGNPAAANGPSIAVSPASLAFSYTVAGANSAPMSFTVSNGGAAALSLTSIATSGTNGSEFRVANTSTCAAGGSVAAGGNCRVDVVFAPTAAGAKSASVTINHNAAGATTSVPLSGSAGAATPTISLSAASLSFGTVPLGGTSPAQTVTLSNTGSAALNITSLATGGSHPGDFTRGGTCAAGGTVAVGATCTITYTFAPAALGARSANLTIASNNSGGNVTLTLSGSGVDNTPAIALSRTTMAFGNQQVGTASAAQAVTVSNAGGGMLSISSVAASNGAFATAGNCVGANLANGQSCTINVSFAPTAAAAVNATLAITHNAVGNPASVALSGSGTTAPVPAVALSRASVSFAGVTAVGQRSIAERVTLTNNGPGSVTLTSVSGSPEFDVVAGAAGACRAGQSLAQGANCSIDVSFAPAAAGARSGTLSIASNATPSTLTASLSGTGSAVAAASAAPNPTAVDFGPVRVGTAAAPRALTIADTGMTNLIVNDIVVDAPFQMAAGGSCGAPPFTLTPGANCTVMVAYQPNAAGTHQGSLQVMSNAAAPAVVTLSGQGQVAAAALPGPTNAGFGGAGALGGALLAALGLLAAVAGRRRATH